jgi:hypothetical protein
MANENKKKANIFDTLTTDQALGMTLPDNVQTAINDKGNTFDNLEAQANARVDETIESDLSNAEAFGLSFGKGMANTARGMENLFNMATGSDTDFLTKSLNLPSKEQEQRAFAPLEEEFPISSTLGEIAGEIVGTAPLGGAAGMAAKGAATASTAAPIVARFAPVIASGTTEGAIMGASNDEAVFGGLTGGVTAATTEALLPPLARRLKRYFGKAKPLDELVNIVDGKLNPTDETLTALKEVGVNFDDIAKEAQEEILNPKQAAVRGAFKAEGIEPASRTRIRPNVSDIQKEGFLLRQAGDDGAADAFREKVVLENEAIKGRFSQIADEMGVGGEEGAEKLKSALFDIKSSMRSSRNRAYQDLADVAKDSPELLKQMPLNEGRIIDGVREVAALELDEPTQKGVVRAFEDFGLIEKAERKGGLDLIIGETEIDKLSIANLHKFRARVNGLFDSAKPKEAIAKHRMIEAIDEVESELVDAFDDTLTDTPKLIKDAAKRARQTVIDEKKIFNERDLIENLVAPKAAGLNAKEAPLTAASKVYGKIVTGATPVENVRKLVGTLIADGSDDSLEALGNLQASTMLDLLDNAVQPSRKLVDASGTTVDMFSGTRLNNQIKKIGEDKIKAIFKNNPQALKSLARLRKIADATITPEEAIQKGSLPPGVLNSAFASISKAKGVPVVGVAGDIASGVQKASAAKSVGSFKPSESDLIDYVILEGNPRITKLLEYAGKYSPRASDVAAITSSSAITTNDSLENN